MARSYTLQGNVLCGNDFAEMGWSIGDRRFILSFARYGANEWQIQRDGEIEERGSLPAQIAWLFSQERRWEEGAQGLYTEEMATKEAIAALRKEVEHLRQIVCDQRARIWDMGKSVTKLDSRFAEIEQEWGRFFEIDGGFGRHEKEIRTIQQSLETLWADESNLRSRDMPQVIHDAFEELGKNLLRGLHDHH